MSQTPTEETGDERFGPAFAAARKARGLSQEDVSAEMERRGHHVALTAISRLEKSQRKVTVGEAIALASIVGSTVEELAGAADPRLAVAFSTASRLERVLARAAAEYGRALLELCQRADAAPAVSAAERDWLDSELVAQSPAWAVASDVAITVATACERDSLPTSGRYTAMLIDVLEADRAALAGRPERR